MEVELLKKVRKVVTHANCADGTASAIILADALKDFSLQEIQFVYYDSPEHFELKAEEGLLFCDFSPPEKRLQEFVDAGAIVLDHHKTIKDGIALFGSRGVYADEKEDPGVSGAVLAYREVYKAVNDRPSLDNLYLASFARTIGVRDTWQKNDPAFAAASELTAALKYIPTSEWFSGAKLKMDLSEILKRVEMFSPIIKANHQSHVEYLAKQAYRFETTRGTKVAVINNVSSTSDVIEKLSDVDVLVGFHYSGESPGVAFSMRSRKGYNVGEIAASKGGGGHSAAAGFRVNAYADRSPYQLIREIITAHEISQKYGASVEPVPDTLPTTTEATP